MKNLKIKDLLPCFLLIAAMGVHKISFCQATRQETAGNKTTGSEMTTGRNDAARYEKTIAKLLKDTAFTRVLTDYIRTAVFAETMVMVHDVVNPPAASRYYAYAMLGAYAVVTQNTEDPGIPDAAAFIKNYPKHTRLTTRNNSYDYRIAALFSILETGKLMLPSGFLLQEQEDKFIRILQKNRVPRVLIDQCLAAGREATLQIVAWSKGDNYSKLSAKLRYTPIKGDQYWYPTPPAYIEAVEPNWRIIRPMVIDSSDQFVPPPLTPFSKDTASDFYKLVMEVYHVSKDTGAQSLYERTIAGFWDCNPFAVTSQGHMMIGFKKMSPGGHWMDITGNVARVAGLDFSHSIQAHTLVAAAIMDAFICCWDEKYKTNRIRPETYINRYIDIKWQPYLQTPPFPEYTSGHSVISTAAAQMLTYLLGTHLDYTDNAEQLFEIAPRTFHSFREAAAEATISRLYGGIHYRDAIVNGQVEGEAVGNEVVRRIQAAGIRPYR